MVVDHACGLHERVADCRADKAKGTQFYLSSTLFWTKLALFVTLLILEVWPMLTFIRWRIQLRRGQLPDTSRARVFYTLNHMELGLVVLIVFVASFMARGFGLK